MNTNYVGVDWSAGAWVTVAYSDDAEYPNVKVFEEIHQVWDEFGRDAHRIVVDVPIGLCESLDSEVTPCKEEDGKLSRRCDGLARAVIGPRWPSVFTPPVREAAKLAANEDDHSEVSDLNRELTGKGLMKLAANISNGIVAVEKLLLDDGGDPEVLVEGHPEVCFRAFNGDQLQHSKKTAPGIDERLSALEPVKEYHPGDWRTIARDLQDEDHNVKPDDVLDALALALTAIAPDEDYYRLPPDPSTDAEGLPMQMVYRSKTKLPELD